MPRRRTVETAAIRFDIVDSTASLSGGADAGAALGGPVPALAGLMPGRRTVEPGAIGFDIVASTASLSGVTDGVAALGGRIRALARVRRVEGDPPLAEVELEVEGVAEDALAAALESLVDIRAVHLTRALDRVFGKRIIVVGGGAQVAQVALGAVSEADRHNLRGERISVDTIPLV